MVINYHDQLGFILSLFSVFTENQQGERVTKHGIKYINKLQIWKRLLYALRAGLRKQNISHLFKASLESTGGQTKNVETFQICKLYIPCLVIRLPF